MIGSGYRPASLQKIYFDSYASSAGIEAANQYVAYPGQSEHQTGLAVDITTVSRNCYLTECFADTSDGQWLANNSYKYGFTLRYPKGKESITGYQYEPWHFRYVGIDLATALYESELTLDEAWQYLQEANDTLRSNGAI
jgi:D-alanyl-D-alanine carboxypeptidase